MMKLLLCTALVLNISSVVCEVVSSKKQKVERCFNLTCEKGTFMKLFEPMFINMGIADDKIKEEIVDKYLEAYKAEYIALYDTLFSEEEIVEMIKFYETLAGKKLIAALPEITNHSQKSALKLMGIINEVLNKPKEAAAIPSALSIDFAEKTKGKSEAELNQLFDQEIQKRLFYSV